MKIIVTGGGSGGHIYPALAVATELRRRGHQVRWIGSRGGMERIIMREAGIDFKGIFTGKLRRYWDWKNVTDLFRILYGFVQAKGVLRQFQPDVVFSKGGYVSVPVCLAARMLGIPVVTHESDTTPGLATRLIVRLTGAKVCAGFEAIEKYFPKKKVKVTGTPVGEYFFRATGRGIRKEFGMGKNDLIVVVFGGSQGALGINRLIWGGLRDILPKAWVIHQTGKISFDEAEAVKISLSRALRDRYLVRESFGNERLAEVLKAADVVVARSGATTLAELSAIGASTILIPLPVLGSRGDQLDNARFFQENGAAIICPQGETDSEDLVRKIHELLKSKRKREKLSERIEEMAQPDAVRNIVEVIEEFAE